LVQGLLAQIMCLERDLERRQTGGFFDKGGKIIHQYQYQNPMDRVEGPDVTQPRLGSSVQSRRNAIADLAQPPAKSSP
jgi:hypothetical protein